MELRFDCTLGRELEPEEIAALPPEPEAPAYIPQSVTARQARLALLAAGHLADAEDALNDLPEPQRTAALIEWEYAAELRRDNALVQAIGAALGLTEEQVDDLFVSAAAL